MVLLREGWYKGWMVALKQPSRHSVAWSKMGWVRGRVLNKYVRLFRYLIRVRLI